VQKKDREGVEDYQRLAVLFINSGGAATSGLVSLAASFAKVWGVTSAEQRGFIKVGWRCRGAKDRNRIREIFMGIFQGRVVFVPISLGEMTSGAITSAAGGEGEGYQFGGRR
jgi:hypothetical protein